MNYICSHRSTYTPVKEWNRKGVFTAFLFTISHCESLNFTDWRVGWQRRFSAVPTYCSNPSKKPGVRLVVVLGGGGVMYYGVVSRHMLTKQNAHKTNAHKTNAHRSYAHTTNAHKTLCSQDIFTRHNAIKTNAHKNIIYTHNTRQMLNIHWETQIPVLASSRSGSKHPHGNQQRVFHKKKHPKNHIVWQYKQSV